MKLNIPKLSRHSFKKALIISSIAVAIVVPLALLTVNWNNLSIVYAAGSSAVAPVMEKLGKTYYEFPQKTSIDITIAATGSGNGLESVVQNTKNFGNVSWAPSKSKIKNTPELEALTAWENNKIKTFTLGIDGIGIVYKAPNTLLNLSQDNIVDFYSAIAGTASYTYGDLIGDASNTIPVLSFARAGGSAKSGTTDAFLKDSGFKNIDSSAPYYKALETGNYGNSVESTKESNVETWKQISSGNDHGKVGSITYLSAGFILNNLQEITSAGFQVATYGAGKEVLTLENIIAKKYNWYRPLNTLLSLTFNKPESSARAWLEWLFYNYENQIIQNALKEVGIVPLTTAQLNSMTLNGNLWVSDFELHPYDVNENYKWGAQL